MNMKESKLGLPIEYQEFPEYFDSHNINEETNNKNEVIEKLLRKQNIKSVLDITCGTGSQVFYLAERGYEIIGNDFSPGLIKIAREKAVQLNLDISFVDGDMRDVKLGKFDAVISIFSAIGHLNKTDFEIALQNIYSNINDEGLYVFDIFNLQALTDEVIKSFVMDIEKTINSVKIHNIQHSEVDRDEGRLISHDQYTIFRKDCEPEKLKNSFALQIYRADELKEILSRNGFDIASQYDMDGNEFIPEKSLNILIVARKK